MPWKKTEPMEQRIEFALKAMRTLNFRALCQEYGISTKTGYKWKERFIREGVEGMVEESRRPQSSPDQLPEEQVCEIVRLKLAHLSWGPRKIRELYLRRHGEVASESTFKRVLERAGLTRKRRRRQRSTEAGRLSSGRRAAAANEVWTVDFKGWWRSERKRCEPLTVRDEHSRYILEVRALSDGRSETVRQGFEQLFERHGLPQAIRSDNGSPFASVRGLFGLSRLSAWWVALGIDLERGRPGHPQDNGGHERMHGDISRELEAVGQSDQAAFDLWRQSFNYERPHEALAMRTPGEVYVASPRKFEGTPEDLDYPQMCARRVSPKGVISLQGDAFFLSTSLAGWSVGLKPIAQQRMEVWFGRLLLGEVDLATESFIRADLRSDKTLKVADLRPNKTANGTEKVYTLNDKVLPMS
jgi:transposase InsO family protein